VGALCQGVTSCSSFVTVVQQQASCSCDVSADWSRRVSTLKRVQGNHCASTSRLLRINNKRRVTRALAGGKRGSESFVCSSVTTTKAVSRNSGEGLGPAEFWFAEKVLRVWKSTQAKPRHSLWVTRVATSPTEGLVEDISSRDESSQADGEEERASSDKSFDWKTNWYPVIPEIDLDGKVPYPFQILGKKVVFWWDNSKWNCVLDACPHRLAPLSEGRVDEQGCIQCSYHGWTFRGDLAPTSHRRGKKGRRRRHASRANPEPLSCLW
jgi:hypothetical protein